MSARTTTPGTLTHEALPFAMIPEWVLFHPALSSNAVRLYGVLMRHANAHRQCWPGLDVLGRETATSRSTVQRAMKELVAVEAVSVSKRVTAEGDPDTNLYYVHWTPPSPADGGPPPADGRGWPAGDTTPGPPVTPGWPAGDAQTRAIEREPIEREVADPTDRAWPPSPLLADSPGLAFDPSGELTDINDLISHREPPSPPVPPPPSSPGYADWEALAGEVGWNPKLNVGLNLRLLKELHSAGVTASQIIGCVEWLRADPWWQARGVDLKKAASKMQDYLSKELRTPTHSVDGYAEMMRDPTLARIFGED